MLSWLPTERLTAPCSCDVCAQEADRGRQPGSSRSRARFVAASANEPPPARSPYGFFTASGDSKSADTGDRKPAMGFLDRIRQSYRQSLPSEERVNELLWEHRTIVTAGTASLLSTIASFPFDSVKSRLQVQHYPRPAIWNCARAVMREEGIGGFFRGVTIPLITITFVRTSSFSIYYGTKERLHKAGYFDDPSKLWHTALSGAAGGATSGILISCGSAPFELVKVQRQLEYLISVQKAAKARASSPAAQTSPAAAVAEKRPAPHTRYKAQSGFQAASAIWKTHGGMKGFYIGFPLHIMRDTLGTTLYFGFYDSMRSLVQRNSTGDSDSGPTLWGVPGPVVSFLTGSTAGIASWLIVYPVDLLKTNVQKRELSGNPNKLTGLQLFARILSERPPPQGAAADSFPKRFLRLYRGLGVSALRSFISHGMTWSLIETLSAKLSKRVGRRVSYVPGAAAEE